jgi:hypothetical protein
MKIRAQVPTIEGLINIPSPRELAATMSTQIRLNAKPEKDTIHHALTVRGGLGKCSAVSVCIYFAASRLLFQYVMVASASSHSAVNTMSNGSVKNTACCVLFNSTLVDPASFLAFALQQISN